MPLVEEPELCISTTSLVWAFQDCGERMAELGVAIDTAEKLNTIMQHFMRYGTPRADGDFSIDYEQLLFLLRTRVSAENAMMIRSDLAYSLVIRS